MLLALLALQPQRRHAREELIELLWPGVELDVGRNRLRQVLSTLRRLLEPPDVPPDSVLSADRQTVGLNADAVVCDVHEFERYLRQGAIAEALDCYRGDLLPGFLDEWVEDERIRLTALYERALSRSVAAGAIARPDDRPRPPGDASAKRAEHAPPSRALPSYVSAFFGREDEKGSVLEALAQHRLVTVAGPGGFGKTRLAIECARGAEGFDTVAFVALSECNDAELIPNAIRDVLRMEASQEDALAQLCAFLDAQDVLLVLDNFEQLVDAGASVLLTLLERLPRLRCLVTSRRVLNVPGEQVLAIDPLPMPQASMGAAEAAATPSLALFIDRARGARADFALTADNRPALIELSRALEGLPLAIEIAASRIRAYSPTEMCAALVERFALLTRQGQRGSRFGRHASLQTTIEWSWDLLSPARQRFFASLSVFRGGWTAAAVGAVCEAPDARAQLEELAADSLLRADADENGVTRFSMLETLREFAQERLDTDTRRLRARHRAYFLQVARQAASADTAIAERDFPNLKQALVAAVEDGEPASALDIGVALRPHWEAHGTLPDELRLLKQALASCPKDEPSLHAGLNLLAELTLAAGDGEQAHGYAQRALEEAGDDPVHRAPALVTVARVRWEREQRGKALIAILDEALALATEAGMAAVQADALRVRATVALKHGAQDADYPTADALFVRAEAAYRAVGQPRWAHRVLVQRAGCLTGLKRYDEARTILARCERYFGGLNSVADLIAVANMTGYLESGQEHWPEAVAAGRRCVQLAWDRHAHFWLALALWNLPSSLVMIGEAALAARLMPFARHFWERSIGTLTASDVAAVEDVRKRVAKHLGVGETKTLWAEGPRLSLAEAVQLALSGRG